MTSYNRKHYKEIGHVIITLAKRESWTAKYLNSVIQEFSLYFSRYNDNFNEKRFKEYILRSVK